MKPAPEFTCAQCGRVIGRGRTHVYVNALDAVWCLRCFSPHAGSREVHARVYPDCPERWHDMYDHPTVSGTRAGIACMLGLWP